MFRFYCNKFCINLSVRYERMNEEIKKTISEIIKEMNVNAIVLGKPTRTDGTKSSPLPELYFMLKQLPVLADYNKILASYMDGHLYLTVAQGKSLLLCNSFQAPDFTTAEYFIFLALKKLHSLYRLFIMTFTASCVT